VGWPVLAVPLPAVLLPVVPPPLVPPVAWWCGRVRPPE